MKRILTLGAAVTVLIVSIFLLRAVAKDGEIAKNETKVTYICPMHSSVRATWAGKCPECGMALVKPDEKTLAAACGCPWCTMAGHAKTGKDGGKKAMSDGMMMRCRMMMNAAIGPNDPAALLALKDELKLTDEQVEKLQVIVNRANEEGEAVLTTVQKEKLKALAETPNTMMGMCRRMMPEMQKTMTGKRGQMTCPWCPWMRGRSGPDTESDVRPVRRGSGCCW